MLTAVDGTGGPLTDSLQELELEYAELGSDDAPGDALGDGGSVDSPIIRRHCVGRRRAARRSWAVLDATIERIEPRTASGGG